MVARLVGPFYLETRGSRRPEALPGLAAKSCPSRDMYRQWLLPPGLRCIACGPVAAFKHASGNANLPIGASKDAARARRSAPGLAATVAVISDLYTPPLFCRLP